MSDLPPDVVELFERYGAAVVDIQEGLGYVDVHGKVGKECLLPLLRDGYYVCTVNTDVAETNVTRLHIERRPAPDGEP